LSPYSAAATAGTTITQRGAGLLRLAGIPVPLRPRVITDSLTHPIPTSIVAGLAAILSEKQQGSKVYFSRRDASIISWCRDTLGRPFWE
jgi:hypothetical protein